VAQFLHIYSYFVGEVHLYIYANRASYMVSSENPRGVNG